MRRLLPVALALTAAAPAAAQEQGSCLTADPPAPAAEPAPLRFGITPRIAGSAGAAQGTAAPEDLDRTARELRALRPGGRTLVLRLNRLFWADGRRGIDEFAALVDRYAAAGLTSEIQVRYHPPEGGEGDIDGWEAFVREAVRVLGARPAVVGFSITNEANFPVSPNTSDGSYDGVVDALVRGVATARDEGARIGRPDLVIGFNVAWRWTPESDASFWREVGAKATPAFRAALDYVGVQVYPGLVWPPVMRPGVSAGEEVAEALTLVRDCYMPTAGLGREVDLWVSENGYATNLGRDEAAQDRHLDSTVRVVHALSTTLGITDYRYFNLRDNDSDGADLFSAVGLLRDDYTPKPAFGTYRSLLGELGARVPRPVLRLALRGRVARGRVVPPAGAPPICAGAVRVTFVPRASRTVPVSRTCRFRARGPRGARRARARYLGAAGLAPAVRRASARG